MLWRVCQRAVSLASAGCTESLPCVPLQSLSPPHSSRVCSITGSCGACRGSMVDCRSTAFPLLQAHVHCEDSHAWNAMLNQVRERLPIQSSLSPHIPHVLWAALVVSAHALRTFIHQLVLPCVALQSLRTYHCVAWSTALPWMGRCASPPPPILRPLPQTNLRNNNNKFYLIQLLEDNLAKQYSVWMRWGRGQCRGRGGEGTCDTYEFV